MDFDNETQLGAFGRGRVGGLIIRAGERDGADQDRRLQRDIGRRRPFLRSQMHAVNRDHLVDERPVAALFARAGKTLARHLDRLARRSPLRHNAVQIEKRGRRWRATRGVTCSTAPTFTTSVCGE